MRHVVDWWRGVSSDTRMFFARCSCGWADERVSDMALVRVIQEHSGGARVYQVSQGANAGEPLPGGSR